MAIPYGGGDTPGRGSLGKKIYDTAQRYPGRGGLGKNVKSAAQRNQPLTIGQGSFGESVYDVAQQYTQPRGGFGAFAKSAAQKFDPNKPMRPGGPFSGMVTRGKDAAERMQPEAFQEGGVFGYPAKAAKAAAAAQTPIQQEPLQIQETETPMEVDAITRTTIFDQEPPRASNYYTIDERIMRALEGYHPEFDIMQKEQMRLSQQRRFQVMEEARRQAYQAGAEPGSDLYNRIMSEAQDRIEGADITGQRELGQGLMQMNREALEQAIGREGTLALREREDLRTALNTLKDQRAKQFFLTQLGQGKTADEIMAAMTTDGTIKPEFASEEHFETVSRKAFDMARVDPELAEVKAEYDQDGDGQLNAAEMDAFSMDERVQAKRDSFMWDIFQAEVEPLEEGGERRSQKKLSTQRINNALSTGNFSGLLDTDFENITDSERAQMQETAMTGLRQSPWKHQADLRETKAVEQFKNANPDLTEDNIGKVFKWGDNYFVLTRPLVKKGDDDARQINVYGVNIKTGKEELMFQTSEYDTEIG